MTIISTNLPVFCESAGLSGAALSPVIHSMLKINAKKKELVKTTTSVIKRKNCQINMQDNQILQLLV